MTVFLVGAGPGDPGLLTLRGRDLLARADVVLHDALVSQEVLSMATPRATLVDVGKLAGAKCVTQATINELLVAYGRAASCVVRLKGGDPFVFGRGGEEALALRRAGIPFEIVPGVSSAIAAPAAAGIPVTHRGVAASVAIVTGHEAAGKDAAVDWATLATTTDALVILMGTSRLAPIVERLVACGRLPDTPAAIVSHGATPQQRTVFGPLRDLPSLAHLPELVQHSNRIRQILSRKTREERQHRPRQLTELVTPVLPKRHDNASVGAAGKEPGPPQVEKIGGVGRYQRSRVGSSVGELVFVGLALPSLL